jgi:hypothetical protein
MSNISETRYFHTEGIYDIGLGLCHVLGNIGNIYDAFDGQTQSIAEDQWSRCRRLRSRTTS